MFLYFDEPIAEKKGFDNMKRTEIAAVYADGEALGGQQVNILRRIPKGQRHGFQFIQMGRVFFRMGETAAVWIVHQEPGVSEPEQLAVIKGLPVEPPSLVNPQNLSALDRNLPALSKRYLKLPERLTKDFFR